MKEMVADKPQLLSIKKSAIYLGLRPAFVYELTARGDIPFVRIGGRKMIKLSDLDKLIQENTYCVCGGSQ